VLNFVIQRELNGPCDWLDATFRSDSELVREEEVGPQDMF
jgi:hypothetical protein